MSVEAVKMMRRLLVHIFLIWHCAGDVIRTRCDIPSVLPGEMVIITCFMPDHTINPTTGLDVRKNETTVLSFCKLAINMTYNCGRTGNETKFQVSMSQNYSISLPLVVASKEMEGTYTCKINLGDPKHTPDFNDCTFTLKNDGTLTAPDNTTASAEYSALPGTDAEHALQWLALLLILPVAAFLWVCRFCKVKIIRLGIGKNRNKQNQYDAQNTFRLWQFCWSVKLRGGSRRSTEEAELLKTSEIVGASEANGQNENKNQTDNDNHEALRDGDLQEDSHADEENEFEVYLLPCCSKDIQILKRTIKRNRVKKLSSVRTDNETVALNTVIEETPSSHLDQSDCHGDTKDDAAGTVPDLCLLDTVDNRTVKLKEAVSPSCNRKDPLSPDIHQQVSLDVSTPRPIAETLDRSYTLLNQQTEQPTLAHHLKKQQNGFDEAKNPKLLEQQKTTDRGDRESPGQPTACRSVSKRLQGSSRDVAKMFTDLCNELKCGICERPFPISEEDAEKTLKEHEELQQKMSFKYEDEIQHRYGHENVPTDVLNEFRSFNSVINFFYSANQYIKGSYLKIRICRENCIKMLNRLNQEDMKHTVEEMTTVELNSHDLEELDIKYQKSSRKLQRGAKCQDKDTICPFKDCSRALVKIKGFLRDIEEKMEEARDNMREECVSQNKTCCDSKDFQDQPSNSENIQQSPGNCDRNLGYKLRNNSKTDVKSSPTSVEDEVEKKVTEEQESFSSQTVDDTARSSLKLTLPKDLNENDTAGCGETPSSDIDVVREPRQEKTHSEAASVYVDRLTSDDLDDHELDTHQTTAEDNVNTSVSAVISNDPLSMP